ncbi:unnamed protein product [Coffea canephora]|uniref:Uncharacterized protein n=1 Tax=Coffea canephora TaxID=49390 RepID=A0A068UHR6_COFCA|nr:unnamed protein product [Coffea canephora]
MNSKTINITISPPSNFRYNAPILHPFFYFPPTKPKFQVFLYSRSHSISSKTERGGVKALPSGAGEAVNEVSQNRLIQVVLVSPQVLLDLKTTVSNSLLQYSRNSCILKGTPPQPPPLPRGKNLLICCFLVPLFKVSFSFLLGVGGEGGVEAVGGA